MLHYLCSFLLLLQSVFPWFWWNPEVPFLFLTLPNCSALWLHLSQRRWFVSMLSAKNDSLSDLLNISNSCSNCPSKALHWSKMRKTKWIQVILTPVCLAAPVPLSFASSIKKKKPFKVHGLLLYCLFYWTVPNKNECWLFGFLNTNVFTLNKWILTSLLRFVKCN